MTDAEYKRLVTATRKAEAAEDEARCMVRLKALGAVEPPDAVRSSAKRAAKRPLAAHVADPPS
jgi:hypothetical protein